MKTILFIEYRLDFVNYRCLNYGGFRRVHNKVRKTAIAKKVLIESSVGKNNWISCNSRSMQD